MDTLRVAVTTGPCIRQCCVACGEETEKHGVQAFVYDPGVAWPFGAVCERCLAHPDATRARLAAEPDPCDIAALPTLDTLRRARKLADAEWADCLP